MAAAENKALIRQFIEEVFNDLLFAIIQNLEQYYVNVHNADVPAGALRGKLSK